MSKKWMGELCLYVISVAYLFLLTSTTGDPLKQEIGQRCDSLLSDPDIDALSAGIIANGKIYKFHIGKLLNGKRPLDENLYEIASLTKTFTGTLIAQAILEGKLSLDDKIQDLLPGEYPNLSFEGQAIRLRHVITHEARLPRMLPDNQALFEDPDFDTLPQKIRELQQDYGKEQFYQDLRKVVLDTLPGYKFSYSNAGANLLGFILEEVYQSSYKDLMHKQIFNPLGMENSAIHWTQANKQVLVDGQSHKKVKMPFMPEKYMSAEGGIVSNVDDMIRYMDFHLNSDKPVVALSHQELWNGKYGEYETGFFWQIIKEPNKPKVFFQNGGAFGTSSWITLIPEQKIGVFLVTNSSGPEIHGKLKETVDAILEDLQ